MAATSARRGNGARFTVRTLLIAMLWLGSVLATYRYAREAGHQAGARQRLGANYSQKYPVGDLLETHSLEQLTAKIQALSPSPWWDKRAGQSAVTYRPTHGGLPLIAYFEADQTFEIYDSGARHEGISELLAELRQE